MEGQNLFNIAVAVCGVAGIPLLTFFWNRIKEAKEEGTKQAAVAIATVAAVAEEGKKLAIEAKKDLGDYKFYVASNHPTNNAIAKMELQIEKMGNNLFAELKEISHKLDTKADKP